MSEKRELKISKFKYFDVLIQLYVTRMLTRTSNKKTRSPHIRSTNNECFARRSVRYTFPRNSQYGRKRFVFLFSVRFALVDAARETVLVPATPAVYCAVSLWIIPNNDFESRPIFTSHYNYSEI